MDEGLADGKVLFHRHRRTDRRAQFHEAVVREEDVVGTELFHADVVCDVFEEPHQRHLVHTRGIGRQVA